LATNFIATARPVITHVSKKLDSASHIVPAAPHPNDFVSSIIVTSVASESLEVSIHLVADKKHETTAGVTHVRTKTSPLWALGTLVFHTQNYTRRTRAETSPQTFQKIASTGKTNIFHGLFMYTCPYWLQRLYPYAFNTSANAL
jgi:hypothetical protein